MSFTGKVAVVTGGGQGIGREVCLKLAEHGAHIVIADISPQNATTATAVRQHGVQALDIYTNLASEADVKNMAKQTLDTLGHVDIIVNNAGIIGATGQIDEFSLDAWNESININLTGMYLVCREFVAALRKQGGSIVNVASVAGKRPLKCRTPYCTTKAAVIGFTKSLAWDLGEWGIRVNCVSPGRVDGPRIQQSMQHGAATAGLSFDTYVHSLKQEAAMQCFITPTSVADAIVFLCSPQAAFITGADLNVNAGSFMS